MFCCRCVSERWHKCMFPSLRVFVCALAYICVLCMCVCVLLASVVLCCRPLSSLSQCHQLLRQPGGSLKASERRPRERERWSMAQSRLAAAVEQHWDAGHVLWVWVRDCTSVCVCVWSCPSAHNNTPNHIL